MLRRSFSFRGCVSDLLVFCTLGLLIILCQLHDGLSSWRFEEKRATFTSTAAVCTSTSFAYGDCSFWESLHVSSNKKLEKLPRFVTCCNFEAGRTVLQQGWSTSFVHIKLCSTSVFAELIFSLQKHGSHIWFCFANSFSFGTDHSQFSPSVFKCITILCTLCPECDNFFVLLFCSGFRDPVAEYFDNLFDDFIKESFLKRIDPFHEHEVFRSVPVFW